MTSILVRMFARPEGILGRLGGLIMARTNRECTAWVIGLLDVAPNGTYWKLVSALASALNFWPNEPQLAMSQGSIRPSKWSRKLRLGTLRLSNAVASTYDAARWRACRSQTTPSTKQWRSIPCNSGRMLAQACERSRGS